MIDFHCHLDLYPDPQSVVLECISRKLYVLSVTTTPSAWQGTSALTQNSKRIQTALGLHPQLAHQRKHELPLFETLLPKVKYVGEIGLDGGKEYAANWGDQILVFNKILELCGRHGGRILSLHSRRAATQVLDALSAHPQAGTPILHWFSGTRRELERAVSMGCWFSVGPAMLAGEKGRAIASEIPREKVLTETDGPFAQQRGRALLPWEASSALETLAGVWSITKVQASNQILDNLRALSRVDIPAPTDTE